MALTLGGGKMFGIRNSQKSSKLPTIRDQMLNLQGNLVQEDRMDHMNLQVGQGVLKNLQQEIAQQETPENLIISC